MQCLKCGRDIAEGQVFCGSCAEVMAAFPVKPGTPVSIPVRPRRESRISRQIKPEEQIASLQKSVRRLRLLAGFLLLALVLSIGALTYEILTREHGPSIGQNYTAVTDEVSQGGR